MRRSCDICGKGTKIGRNRSHAQNRSRRTFKANIHRVTLMIKGKKVKGDFCTGCLAKAKRASK